jgi:uncharacterized protein
MTPNTPPTPKLRGWTAHNILETLMAQRAGLHELGVRKIGLFGSYARGEQTPDSDLDFVVVLTEGSLFDYLAVKFFLEDLFALRVDVVEERAIKPRLRPYIFGEVIYAEGL